jgi:hypothetical protein
MAMIEGHAGQQAVSAIAAFETDVMFTLNGGHIWPLYEAARDQGMRVVDVRHEQSATNGRSQSLARSCRSVKCSRQSVPISPNNAGVVW